MKYMASSDFKVNLTGDKALKNLLNTLPSRVLKKGMRAAQSKAATPMLQTAKALCPTDSGLLRRSLKRKQKTYSGGNVITMIGPDRNVKSPGVDLGSGSNTKIKQTGVKIPANYSHLVEGGHGGPHAAPAHEFMKPAYEQNKAQSADIMKAALLNTLLNEAKKQK